MDYPTEGGSYTRDPKTGKLTLVHRTEGNAVWAKPEEQFQESPGTAETAPLSLTPTTPKPEKA